MNRNPETIGHVTINPEILGGKPVIAGTRVPVELILEFLANDWQPEKILSEYPSLHKPDIQATLAYANKRVKNEQFHFYVEPDI